MKNKLVNITIGFLLIMMLSTVSIVETISASNYLIKKERDERTTCDNCFIDAFIIGIIRESRKDQFEIVYFNATIVYTTEFHGWYIGEMEISGFRGVITSSFICGFYNNGW